MASAVCCGEEQRAIDGNQMPPFVAGNVESSRRGETQPGAQGLLR